MNDFDYGKTYYRILRPDDEKYKEGVNNSSNTSEDDCFYSPVCLEDNYGGFYFVGIDGILDYSYHWGDMICDVMVNEGQPVYQEKDRTSDHFTYRAGEIMLSNKRKLTRDVIMDLVAMGGKLHPYMYINLHSQNVTHLTDDEKQELITYFKDNIENLDGIGYAC